MALLPFQILSALCLQVVAPNNTPTHPNNPKESDTQPQLTEMNVLSTMACPAIFWLPSATQICPDTLFTMPAQADDMFLYAYVEIPSMPNPDRERR